MSIRSVVLSATAAIIAVGAGTAAAQTSYAPTYRQGQAQAYAQPYAQQGYAQGYGQQGYRRQPYYAAPYTSQSYGPASYVQPSYGSPYAPRPGDPFPEQPAAYRQQGETLVVSSSGTQTLYGGQPVSGARAPRSVTRAAQPAAPMPSAASATASTPTATAQPKPIAVEPPPAMAGASGAAAATAAGKPEAPEGTFDALYAARDSEPEVAEWTPDPHEGYGGWLSELRFGILEHDAGVWSGKKEDGLDINGEVLFTSPDFLDIIFSPRPTIGGSIHTQGETNVIYFGLTWEWNIFPWLYLEGQWGPAFHDGNLTGQTADKKGFGCPVLSRGSLALGVRFYDHHSIQAFYSHMSNGDLCSENDGIDAAGIRYGYRF